MFKLRWGSWLCLCCIHKITDGCIMLRSGGSFLSCGDRACNCRNYMSSRICYCVHCWNIRNWNPKFEIIKEDEVNVIWKGKLPIKRIPVNPLLDELQLPHMYCKSYHIYRFFPDTSIFGWKENVFLLMEINSK